MLLVPRKSSGTPAVFLFAYQISDWLKTPHPMISVGSGFSTQWTLRQYMAPTKLRDDYDGVLRQIAVSGLGREQPTLFLTNHPDASPRQMIVNYARRNGIEDGLGTNVNFFHMDNLSSEVRLNVDLDVTLTVIANFAVLGMGQQPPPWFVYAPLPPLFLMLLTGLYMFVLPYTTRRAS